MSESAVRRRPDPLHWFIGWLLVVSNSVRIVQELLKARPAWITVEKPGLVLVLNAAAALFVYWVAQRTGQAFGVHGKWLALAVALYVMLLLFNGVLPDGCGVVLGVMILCATDDRPGRLARRAWNYIAPRGLTVAMADG